MKISTLLMGFALSVFTSSLLWAAVSTDNQSLLSSGQLANSHKNNVGATRIQSDARDQSRDGERTGTIPDQIDFQGRLSNTDGTPLAGTVSILFSLYDVASGGSSLWSEVQSVAVVNGLFHASQGSVNPISETDFAEANRWIGLTINGDSEMSPRSALNAVP